MNRSSQTKFAQPRPSINNNFAIKDFSAKIRRENPIQKNADL
jgi:hypothetical protein